MAEYWKSQPRKLCEFCKCWITDNKPSIEFHERGKKHKENVQRRIEEVQKKGREVSKAQKQLQNDLAAIEAAALKAYQNDMNIQPSVPKSVTSLEPTKKVANETCSKGETTEACSVTYEGSQAVMKCSHGWNIGQAPEGYYYYYNAATQASQWESPSCLSSSGVETPRNSTGSKPANQGQPKNAESESGENKTSEPKKVKVKNSPYGQWTTVHTSEPALPAPEKANSTTEDEEKPKESAKPEEKFKERSTPRITFRSASGVGTEVAFKKRKLNPDKKRNVRQTDPNKTD
ncbi:WW domain-binding protein 4-like [Montipora capricornis]|uniref:WW domain-binding protein 4-like n=1 Tax=Montipora capricornis TaxID=246305 RepID=UPI0035F21169